GHLTQCFRCNGSWPVRSSGWFASVSSRLRPCRPWPRSRLRRQLPAPYRPVPSHGLAGYRALAPNAHRMWIESIWVSCCYAEVHALFKGQEHQPCDEIAGIHRGSEKKRNQISSLSDVEHQVTRGKRHEETDRPSVVEARLGEFNQNTGLFQIVDTL